MTDIASAIKAEITRLARKEVRAQMEPLKKSATQTKALISALRAEVSELKAQLKQLGKPAMKNGRTTAAAQVVPVRSRQRFTAKGFASMRRRLGLSRAEMGQLVNASEQSIFNWEEGVSHPRDQYLHAIFELRHIGKRKIIAKLAAAEKAK